MKLTTEQIEHIKSLNSVEELINEMPNVDPNTLKTIYNQYKNGNNSGELGDEELENVAGGTCYSGGVTCPADAGNLESRGKSRPYVIVTAGNSCPLNGATARHLPGKGLGKTCGSCPDHFTISPTMYCSVRWEGHDTVWVKRDGWRSLQFGFKDD